MKTGICTRLSEKIANAVAVDMHMRAMALINAGPRIRAAEYLETKLRDAGLAAEAVGEVALHNAIAVQVHVLVRASEAEVVDALLAHNIFFDRHVVRGQIAAHYDCNVGSYNVAMLVTPPNVKQIREAA